MPLKKAVWHGLQLRTRAGRDPTRRVVWVSAEGGDVVAHPAQRGDLVQQATIVRKIFKVGESLGAGAVVDTDHHGTARR